MANKIKSKNNKFFSYINRDSMDEDCNNNLSHKAMKQNSNITQSQQEFINAVNELNNTIDILNI